MKILLTSFNTKLGVNPLVSRLFEPLPEIQLAGVHDCEAVFLSFIAPESDFVPDKLLLDAVSRRKLPVIIFDHSETFPSQFIFPFDDLASGPYAQLRSVVREHMDVKAYFKRELLPRSEDYNSTFAFPVHALDWTLHPMFGDPPVDTPEQYHARPIDIFFSWGYSNESRPKLMGELLRQAGSFHAHWALTEEDLDRALAEGRERIFALLFTPHYRRIHIKKLMEWQQKSKLAISMNGAGRKCFRDAEASYNCAMAREAPGLVEWSYPWKDSQNCIGLAEKTTEEERVRHLYFWLRTHQGLLYPVYTTGTDNAKRYQNSNYAREYLWPKIEEALK